MYGYIITKEMKAELENMGINREDFIVAPKIPVMEEREEVNKYGTPDK